MCADGVSRVNFFVNVNNYFFFFGGTVGENHIYIAVRKGADATLHRPARVEAFEVYYAVTI